MKRLYFLVILVSACSLMFGQTKVGSTAAPFLSIGIGPRAVGMGGAFTATANDITALYWNPAGVSRMGGSGAYFSHTKWFADINFNYAAAMLTLGDWGTVGGSVTLLDYGETEITTVKEPDGTGAKYGAKDMALGLHYAMNLTDRFSIGGTVKYVQQSIWNTSASTVAFDLGVLFLSEIYGLRIGATISNFGGDMTMDGKDLYVLYDIDPGIFGNNDQILAKLKTDPYPLPLTFKVGAAMDVINSSDLKLTLGVDALHPSDNSESINVGGEIVYKNLIALRGGYKSLFLDNAEEGLTLGVGLNYDIAPNLGLSFDYAYQDFGLLKNTQFFSLGIKF
ncbi:MAG: PorV/PorQ family protein [Bacteroidetes bacterium]|nr:PorV/PorQ family protein [Bacteroidota bacterium]